MATRARQDRAQQRHPLCAVAAGAAASDLWGAPEHLPVLLPGHEDCRAGGEARYGQP